FYNAPAITIPHSGAGTPYSSSLTVSNMGGSVSNVTLTLRNLSHTWTRDIGALLVGPAGQALVLMRNAGNGGANNVSLTFSDAATSDLPLDPLTTGTFRPADYPPANAFPSPAPPGPYGAALSAFN